MPSEDSKAVKKREIEDEEDEKSIATLANRNKKSPYATAKTQSRVKKEAKKEEDHVDFEEPISRKTSKNGDSNATKGPKKKKKEEEEEKKKGAKQGGEKDVKKRERKVYDLPGQKRDPPEERDPLRIFYESLYEQVPGSEMAAIWMMESGLLPEEEAQKVLEKKQKKAQQQKLSSPMKSVVTVKKKGDSMVVQKKSSTTPESTQRKKSSDSKVAPKQSKKRKNDDGSSEDDDDDFVLSARKQKKQRAS